MKKNSLAFSLITLLLFSTSLMATQRSDEILSYAILMLETETERFEKDVRDIDKCWAISIGNSDLIMQDSRNCMRELISAKNRGKIIEVVEYDSGKFNKGIFELLEAKHEPYTDKINEELNNQ